MGNSKFKRYGKLLSIKLDSKNQSLHFEALLKGEREPLEIEVIKYELEQENGEDYIYLKEVKTSKEWLNYLIDDYLLNQRYKLPKKAAGLLNAVLKG